VSELRAAVLGAGGTIGPAIVADLGRSAEVSELLLLDLVRERAETVAAEHGYGKARGAAADASDAANLADAIRDCDVLVNSASYRVNVKAMEACLDAGCHYLDLGGLYWVQKEQFETFGGAADRFERAGLLAVLGIGSAPGKTNLMGERAKRELGDVERMDVAAGGRDLDPPDGFSVPYALRTLIDELTLPPVVIRGGEPVEIEPLTDGGTVDFGDPIGEAASTYTLHSEMLTFPDSFRCSDGSFRLSLAPELLSRLRELAEASPAEIERAAAEAVPPSANTVAVHLVEATRAGRTIRVRSVTTPVEGTGIGGGVTSTAAPAAATLRLLARDQIATRGVHPPERCIESDDLFAELEQRGSKFDVEIREAGADRAALANPAAPGREAEDAAGIGSEEAARK
jgi:saccharopine dehydrogenase-like NADP-dependent oxidoreductase